MIITDDAERLVREGGLWNCFGGTDKSIPFEAVVSKPSWKGTGAPQPEDRAGRVLVVDVHRADDCGEFERSMEDPLGIMLYCHDDAEPDRWHWTVETLA